MLKTTNNNKGERTNHQALFDSIPQSGLKCDILFLVIKNRLREEPEYVKRLRVVFQFNITKNGQLAATWTSDTRTCIEGDIYRGAPKVGLKADCILTVDDEDWVKIMVGKLNPQRAFMMAKFHVKGNIMLLQKLHLLWYELRRAGKAPELDLIQDVIVNETVLPGLKSEAMAIEMVQRVARWPHIAEQINGTLQVNIHKDGKLATQYLVRMYPGKKPEFERLFNWLLPIGHQVTGQKPIDGPIATITIEDDDFVLVMFGICDVDEAIAAGKLQVVGDLKLVERAKVLFKQSPIMSKL